MCEVCNKRKAIKVPNSNLQVSIINQKLHITNCLYQTNCKDIYKYASEHISFCPMCGANLIPLDKRYYRIQSFTIKSKLPSLNEYIQICRTNKYSANKFKKDVEEVILYYILQSKIQSINKPVYLYFEWHEPSKHRDIDNVYSAKKFILDALQKIGVIQNDSPKWVLDCNDKIIYDKSQKVIIELREVNK